jgi:hypothetical protein
MCLGLALTCAEFRSGKASDIISTLVSIYESREVIIQELQALLASRLLAIKDYDAVKEVGNSAATRGILADPTCRSERSSCSRSGSERRR